MNILSIVLLAGAVVLAPLAVGCSGATSSDANAAAGDEADVVTQTDAALKKELADAIVGLETGGGEGDADPYKLTDLKLAKNEEMTNDVLLKKLLPKLTGVARTDDPIPGLDETPIAKAWEDYLAEPKPADFDDPADLAKAKEGAAKWRKVKQIVDAKLHNVKYFDMGYRGSANGSLETGAVAHVIVGQSATGRVFAIWGIDIWT